jgi:hypothetical protein
MLWPGIALCSSSCRSSARENVDRPVGIQAAAAGMKLAPWFRHRRRADERRAAVACRPAHRLVSRRICSAKRALSFTYKDLMVVVVTVPIMTG